MKSFEFATPLYVRSLLAFTVLAMAPHTARAGFLNGDWTGRVKCPVIYNSGTAGPYRGSPFSITLTLATPGGFEGTEQGTAAIAQPPLTTGSLFGDFAAYAAELNVAEGKGKVVVYPTAAPTYCTGLAVGEFRIKKGKGSMTFTSLCGDTGGGGGFIQRCTGRLKSKNLTP